MIDAPEGTPWWAWLIAVVVIAICSVGAAMWQRLGSIDKQVGNDHKTNLRDDVDKLTTGLERVEGYLRDLDKTIRAVQHSMVRRDGIQETAIGEIRTDLAAHLEDVPRLLQSRCPFAPQEEGGGHGG